MLTLLRAYPRSRARMARSAWMALLVVAASCDTLAPQLELVLSQPEVHFRAVRGSTTTVSQTITVQNGGDGRLGPVSCPAAPASWLACSVTGGNSLKLTANPAGLTTSPAAASVAISAPGAKSSTNVQVDLAVDQPLLSVSAGTVAFAANEGAATTTPASVTVNATNSGAGTLLNLGGVTCAPVPANARVSCSVNQGTGAVILTVDPSTLTPGAYVFPVQVTAVNSSASQTIAVSLTLNALPRIVLSQRTLSFSAIRGSTTPLTQTVSVTNSGSGSLGTLSCPAGPATWLACSVSGATLTFTASPSGLAASPSQVTVNVAGTGAANSPQAVTVNLAIEQPLLTLNNSAVSFTASQGATTATPATAVVAVTNTGAGNLSNLGTISCVPATGTPVRCVVNQTSGNLTLSVDPTGITPGDYLYSVTVSAPNSGVSRAITVTLSIGAQPKLVLSPQTLQFNAIRGSTTLIVKTVAITNSGNGSLGTIACPANPTAWLACVATDTTTLTLTVNPSTLTASPVPALVNVTSSLASNSPQVLTVNLTIDQPVLTLSASSVTFTVASGSGASAPITVTATNSGTPALADLGTIACSSNDAHASCSVNQTTGVLTLTVNPSTAPALVAGKYFFLVTVNAPNMANAPQTLVVIVTVT